MSTISITLSGGPKAGQVVEKEWTGLSNPTAIFYTDYELDPKIAIRPAEVEHPETEIELANMAHYSYVFSAWVIFGATAIYVPG